MIIKVCDRCGKQFYPIQGFMQAELPSYNITTIEGGFSLNWRQVDLCSDCQNDFKKWMNAFKTSDLLVEIDGDISNEGEK